MRKNNVALCLQLIETLQLTSIKDRLWRVQPCSALLNEGIDVSVLFLSDNYCNLLLIHRTVLTGCVKMYPQNLDNCTRTIEQHMHSLYCDTKNPW